MMRELLNTQTDAEKTQNNLVSTGYKREEIENSPFTLITDEKGKTMLVMGNAVVQKEVKNIDATKEEIEMYNWGLILTACAVYYDIMNEYKASQAKTI